MLYSKCGTDFSSSKFSRSFVSRFLSLYCKFDTFFRELKEFCSKVSLSFILSYSTTKMIILPLLNDKKTIIETSDINYQHAIFQPPHALE